MKMIIGFTDKFGRYDKRILLVAISISIMLISAACSHNQATPNNIEKDKQQAAQKKAAPTAKMDETQTKKATPDNVRSAVYEQLGLPPEKGAQKITDVVIDHGDHIIINFTPDANANESLLPYTIQQDIANILWGIKKGHFMVKSVELISNQSQADQSGNSVQKKILDVTYLNESINKTDFESMNTDNLLSMADNVTYIDPVLHK